MYNITSTNAHAMGNAFRVHTPTALKSVIILADSEMQLIKALTEKHTNYTGYERINNIQADTMQREGVHTFIIETV